MRKLEKKKDRLEAELITAGKADDTSDRYRELRKELKVIRKLIKKAKKHNASV
jgi:Mg2+ and Co2+ transporter CorA